MLLEPASVLLQINIGSNPIVYRLQDLFDGQKETILLTCSNIIENTDVISITSIALIGIVNVINIQTSLMLFPDATST